MTLQILKSALVLMIANIALIKFIGGECDRNWKEWLAAFVVIEMAIATVAALVLIWQ